MREILPVARAAQRGSRSSVTLHRKTFFSLVGSSVLGEDQAGNLDPAEASSTGMCSSVVHPRARRMPRGFTAAPKRRFPLQQCSVAAVQHGQRSFPIGISLRSGLRSLVVPLVTSSFRSLPSTSATTLLLSDRSDGVMLSPALRCQRHLFTPNPELIDPTEISFMEEEPAGGVDGAEEPDSRNNASDRSAEDLRPAGIRAASSKTLPTVFKDVKKIDTFSRGRVMSFIKRYHKGTPIASADQLFETTRVNLSSSLEGEAEESAEALYHSRLLVPLMHPLWEDCKIEGGLWAHGVASEAKTAENLAAMHAEYIIDDLGYQIYSLPSMQRKHVAAAQKEGRYACPPDDGEQASEGRTPTLESFPLPLRRVVMLDESENGEWQLLEVRPTTYLSPQHALLSPCVVDKQAEERIRTFFRAKNLAFMSHCMLDKEEPVTKGGVTYHTATIAFPKELFVNAKDSNANEEDSTSPPPPPLPSVVAKGKASSMELAVTLACMHAELILDALYLPLFPKDEFKQKSHAMSAWSFGRTAPAPGATPKNPDHVLLPLPLKEIVLPASGSRHSKPNTEEDLVRKQRFLTEQVTEFLPTVLHEMTAVNDLRDFLRRMKFSRYEHPFFTEQIQHHYKSTVWLPVDSSHGICGGVGVASSKRDADILAAMHALDILNHLGIPVKSDPEEQERWLAKRQRLLSDFGALAPSSSASSRPPGRRLDPKGFCENVAVDLDEEEDAEVGAHHRHADEATREKEGRGSVEELDSSRKISMVKQEEQKNEAAETVERETLAQPETNTAGPEGDAPRRRVVKRAKVANAATEERVVAASGANVASSDTRNAANSGTATATTTPSNEKKGNATELEKEAVAQKRSTIPSDLWKLEADSPDGYIMVAPTEAGSQLLLLDIAIRSPRQMNHSAKARVIEYLAQMGRRFEDVFQTRKSEEDSRSGNTIHECIGKIPVPAKFGDRVAVGKAAGAVDAEILAAMHAELLLDALGIAIFADPVKQMRHAKECARNGRWAPKDHQSLQDASTPTPPPLRLEYSGSLHWERSRKTKRVQPRSVSPKRASVPAGAASHTPEPVPSATAAVSTMPKLSFANTDSDPNELNDIPDMGADVVHTIVSEEDLDLVSKARVQYYLRRKGKTATVEYKSMMGRGTLIHIASGVLPLPDGHEAGKERKMEGIATTKRDAEVLAWVHAERTLDKLGIEIFDNLPGLQRYHALRAQEVGRWAPSVESNSKDHADLTEIPPLRLSSFLKQLQKPVLASDSLEDWNFYIMACDDYIKSKTMQSQNIFFDQERAPRTGDKLIDSTLDDVEGKPIDVESKRLLQLYCNAADLEYPSAWPVRVAGPLSHRVSWVTICVPGFPHLHAQGVGSNKEAASRRAAMHALAILKIIDGDFESYYQEAKERMLDTAISPDATAAPLLTKAHENFVTQPTGKKGKQRRAKQNVAIWDRGTEDFTPEGKDRLILLYSVCLGLPAPKIEDRVAFVNGKVIRSTVVELVDEDGKKWSGRGQTNSGTSENRRVAITNLFSELSYNNPTMHELMELLRQNPFLDPEKIANVSLTKEQEATMQSLINDAEPQGKADFESEDDVFVLKQSAKAEDEDSEKWSSKFYKSEEEVSALSVELRERLARKLQDSEYLEKFASKRQKLSIAHHKSKIIDAVEHHPVLILCGTTGCGKTTQVPQFILDHYTEKEKGGECCILVTQPRRLSAVSIAQRVAAERQEQIGDMCGYSIRFDTKLGKSINFCTSGVLLRMLHTSPLLDGITVLIIDEIHERDINSDFILVLLQDLIQKRKDLRVILMSATLQAELFSGYFNNAPVINVEGYVHPVQDLFLEDLVPYAEQRQFMTPLLKEAAVELEKERSYSGRQAPSLLSHEGTAKYGVLEAVTEIDYVAIQFAIEQAERMVDLTNSSILVFLPGWEEITRAKEILERNPLYQILPLHSSVGNEEQMQCFLPAENGKRKVILSTNIAESGVTIDDIGAVIDSGRAKEKSYSIKKQSEAATHFRTNEDETTSGNYYQGTVSQLMTVYASRANCTQRRGRVGRTRPGICIRLYTRQHFNQLHDFQTPEMLRTPLDTLCLNILSLQLGDPRAFLRNALEPPPEEYIDAAMNRLHELGATTPNGHLTPLGMRLSLLPVEPSSGKMILMGAVLKCLDAALTVASVTQTDVFSSQRDHREPVRLHRENFSKNSQSDAIASINGYNFWVAIRTGRDPAEVQRSLENHLLSVPQLLLVSRLKRQFFSIIRTSRFLGREMQEMTEKDFLGDEPEVFVDRSEYSSNALDVGLVKCVIASGLFPNIAINRGKRLMRTKEELFIAPSSDSVVYKTRQQNIQQPFFVFSELSRSQDTNRLHVRGLTGIPLWTMLLMGTASMPVTYRHDLSLGIVDGWMVFRASFQVLELIRKFKHVLNSCLSRKFIEPDDQQNNERLDRMREVIKDLVNSAFRPNNIVEQEWQEKGEIISPYVTWPSTADSIASSGTENWSEGGDGMPMISTAEKEDGNPERE